jgi:hypothetical protein
MDLLAIKTGPEALTHRTQGVRTIAVADLALALLRGVRAGGIVEEAGAEADDRSGGEVEAEAAA